MDILVLIISLAIMAVLSIAADCIVEWKGMK